MNEETAETPAEEVTEAVVAEDAAVEETAPKTRRSRKQAEEAVEPEATEVVVKEAPAPAAKTDTPAYPALAITSGGQHDSIKAAQKKLGVAETGVVDADTKAAVKAVQKKAGLKADGTISANTWAAIFA